MLTNIRIHSNHFSELAQLAELALSVTWVNLEAGGVEFAHVELHADDGKHDDGKEEQQPNLQQGNHGFHDGLQDHLQAYTQGEQKRREG